MKVSSKPLWYQWRSLGSPMDTVTEGSIPTVSSHSSQVGSLIRTLFLLLILPSATVLSLSGSIDRIMKVMIGNESKRQREVKPWTIDTWIIFLQSNMNWISTVPILECRCSSTVCLQWPYRLRSPYCRTTTLNFVIVRLSSSSTFISILQRAIAINSGVMSYLQNVLKLGK